MKIDIISLNATVCQGWREVKRGLIIADEICIYKEEDS